MLPLKLIPDVPKFRFAGLWRYAYVFSLLLTIGIFIAMFVKGLNLGIDFSGGIVIEVRNSETVAIDKYREALTNAGYSGAIIQNIGEKDVLFRIQSKHEGDQSKEIQELKDLLKTEFGEQLDFRKTDYVGPKVGQELVWNGFLALFIALISIMIYVWFRFDWQFGIGAIISLLHDAIATLGFYIVSGYDFDLSSIAAILLIVGYSINDTVVIYDRIRENLRKYKSKKLSEIINLSINETLSRTVMTVATTLLVCLSLVLVGGEANKGFSMAMLFGIAFGTYSSVFIAAPILMVSGVKTASK